ncbi:hypothetical protein FACS1894176_00780 [Bacteroidia bacterium]|nr:hypothetical protein FACS1894176_00780 [Bacteroidia bacterium]
MDTFPKSITGPSDDVIPDDKSGHFFCAHNDRPDEDGNYSEQDGIADSFHDNKSRDDLKIRLIISYDSIL